ncbi:alpha/beta hydrolase [Flavobacteriaceae bacterium TP-CH-4]|uniref:Alpha/beta hydrolase n=1 Tax=Pelagihabitans pacificus TaxID=2696054 RepID=A0A967E6H4_9FLAO|nr:alpha/beta hydrolase [Pelagihabitans pacificus]NHF60527.1 alpha/beta hydrolase [Pelagihabitans pacificus]
MTKNLTCFVVCLFVSWMVAAQKRAYEHINDLSYLEQADESGDAYRSERCKLDVYYPKDTLNTSAIVWFHGGGLEFGEKHIPYGLREKGVIVVTVNYRLYPKVQHPSYIEDAAAAVAWTFQNIEKYNGNPKKIFVTGHSAGGYLASMVGLDTTYLAKHDIDADDIAGLIPFSGHTITHFTVRKEMGIAGTRPLIDRYAPLYHVRQDAPPILLITGNRELELLGRYEENAYFYRMMKVVGHPDIELMELDGYGHDMVYPAIPLLLDFVVQRSKEPQQ